MAKYYQMTGSKILVKRFPRADQTNTGIMLPDAVQKSPSRGTVLAVGPGIYSPARDAYRTLIVKPGDVVAFNHFAGEFLDSLEPSFTESDLIVLSGEDEILAIERDAED